MEEKVFRSQEQSALRYCPISTRLAHVVDHFEGLPGVMFECLGLNVRPDKDEKLFRPQEQSVLRNYPIWTKLARVD
jgi:hypothetical protein